MQIFLLLLLLIISGQTGHTNTVTGNSYFQSDRHIQAIIDGRDIVINYWYLTQIAAPGGEIERAVLSRIRQIGSSVQNEQVACLFEALDINLSESTLSSATSKRLLQAHTCINSDELIIAALYESPDSQRESIYDKYGDYLDNGKITTALVNKALNRDYNPDDLLTRRPFSLPDVYLFNNYVPTDNNAHYPLVDYWEGELKELNQVKDPLDFLKIQTVVTALHTINWDYQRIGSFLPLLRDNDYFSNTLGKHILFKRVVFATQIQGYYQTALNFYRNDLIPLSESIMDAEEYLRVRMDYGSILFRLGDVKSALEIYQSIDEHPHQLQDERYISALLNNLAVSYLNAGYFDNYLTLQIRAFEQAKRSSAYTAQLRILNNLYIYHWRNQDWNAAMQYLNLALLVAQEHELTQELADIYVLYGTYYRSKEQNYDRAIYLFEQSLLLIDKEADFRSYTYTVSELILTFDDAGRIDDAKSRRLQLLDEVIERNNTQVILELKSQLIDSYLDLNDLETATQYYKDIKNLDRDNLDFRLNVRVTNSIFRYLAVTGNTDEALQVILPLASEIVTNVRLSGDLHSGSIRIEPGFVHTFKLLIDCLLALNRTNEAIVWLDEFKNLNKASYINSSLLKSTILNEEQFLYDIQLTNQIEQLRSEYSTSNTEQRFVINNELLKLLDEKNRINNIVLQNFTTEPLNVRDVQRKLSRDEQILSFTVFDSVMYVTSITRNQTEVDRIKITSEDEELSIAVISGLNQTRTNLHQLNDIYERFFSRYINKQTARLLIVPDYFVYQIPAEILPVNRTKGPFNYGSAIYLIENMAVSYQNSLADIVTQSTRNRNQSFGTNFVGVAVSSFEGVGRSTTSHTILGVDETQTERTTRSLSSLPYAKVEIERSYSLLDWLPNRKKFIDSEGTKSNLISNATDTRILHIASHSEVYNSNPLFSVIHLHPDSDNSQGQVYAYELFNLNINSELIVLSSCDSGSGTFVQGSGIIGLGRALNFAGANSLILNMWSVRDQAAAELMTSFYEEARGNTDKDVALREAKVRYINSVNSDPAVWGSLILFGDTAPVSEPWPWVRTIALSLLLLLALILIGRSYYRK